jgi:dienelactone hydrolase
MKILYALMIVPLVAFPAAAQVTRGAEEKPGDKMIYQHLCAETDRLSQKFLDGAQSLDEWLEKRPRLHREYMDMLGLWPMPEKTPLKATQTGIYEAEDFIIEKLHFQSRPGLYVTANLYRPYTTQSEKARKLPAILYVCGHSNRGRDGNKSAYQDHGMWFAKNGYVCLVVDTLQLGEIPGIHHGTYGIRERKPVETRWWWHSAGYTPAGVECWNGIRAIDYLLTRPDVDPERIGVTGISGGGAATFWIAAADPRVKVAVPVSGMSDLESYVKNKVINGHCDCMFLYNTYQWDWTTIAALVAPRPMLFANSDNDSIFPMDGNRRVIAKLRTLYQMYGKPDLVDEYVSKGGHAYRPDLRLAIFKFINKHLKGDTATPVKDIDFPELPGKLLRVFPTDADIPKDVLNGQIDQTFVPRANVNLPEQGEFAKWRSALISDLRARSLRTVLPDIAPARMAPPSGTAPAAVFESEAGIRFRLGLYFTGKKPSQIVVLDSWQTKDQESLLSYFGLKKWEEATDVMLVCPRGSSAETEWSEKSPPNYVRRSHALLGDSISAGRINDILAAIRFAKSGTNGFRLVGQSQAGVLAAYAALFEPSVKEVVIIDPPRSHMQGPYLLNVLRILDIPEALGLLAPHVHLTLIHASDHAFDRTEQIYRLAGAADKWTRK